MTEDAGTIDPSSPDGDDDESPVLLPPFGVDDVAGFCERLMAHLADETRDEIEFEGVEVEQAHGIWLVPLGAVVPEAAADAPGEGASDDEVEAVLRWTDGARRALHDAWGEPSLRTPRRVGSEQEPEGIVDHMLLSLGVDEVEMWDRGERFVLLLSGWTGEERASALRQVLLVLPRAMAMGGLAAAATDEHTVHPLLMHGEHPLELHRRAWIVSALHDVGELRVRGPVIDGTRCSRRMVDGTTTVWTFADDGRILLLIDDPHADAATEAPRQLLIDMRDGSGSDVDPAVDARVSPGVGWADHVERDEELGEARLILSARMLSGVPDDLLALVDVPGVRGDGTSVDHPLVVGSLGGAPVPRITGVCWFDGETWRVPATLLEVGLMNGFGLDDFGFRSAVRRPYLLGGPFTIDRLIRPDHEQRPMVERVLAACPYPEQERPSDAGRLAYGVPAAVDHAELVAQLERASDAWWQPAVGPAARDERDLEIGGRPVDDVDGRMLVTRLGTAEPWNHDAFERWTDGLEQSMTLRWGAGQRVDDHDDVSGRRTRSPLSELLRQTGLGPARMWWVDGHAVLLLAGMPGPDYGPDATVLVVVARPDAVWDVALGLEPWWVRHRLRVVSELQADLVEGVERPRAVAAVPWRGPAIEGSTIVPDATRGQVRAEGWLWTWFATHVTAGPRMLLLGTRLDRDDEPDAAEIEAQLRGVPESLLSLAVDRVHDGLLPIVRRPGEARSVDPLEAARVLPVVDSVLWIDGMHWCASDRMMRVARDAVRAQAAGVGPATANPLQRMYGPESGVPALQTALATHGRLDVPAIVDPHYATAVLGCEVDAARVQHVVDRIRGVHAQALGGTLGDVLDRLVEVDGLRELRGVLDAALSHPHPGRRREIALWILSKPVDASVPLSFLTPVNVLLENATLDADDAVLVERLLERGATAGAGVQGAAAGGHPLVQLARRDLEEETILPIAEVLVARGGRAAITWDDAPLLAEVARAATVHGRPRERLVALVQDAIAAEERRVEEARAWL